MIALPEEWVENGSYLLIEDDNHEKGLIIQVLDSQYVNLPGVLEDLLRENFTQDNLYGEDYDPLNVSSQISMLKDALIITCKIRGVKENDVYKPFGYFLPSRMKSTVEELDGLKLFSGTINRPVIIGKIKNEASLSVDVEKVDGRLNIITGKKGTGKSHLSKLLLLGLVEKGAPCFVLDINGEYINLNKGQQEHSSEMKNFIVLTPKRDFKFDLRDIGLYSILNILVHALDLPWNSSRVFSRIWNELKDRNQLRIKLLGEKIQGYPCHESIKEALYSRYLTFTESGLFTDNDEERLNFIRLLMKIQHGGAIIVNLRDQSNFNRRMIVELFLSKLHEILHARKIRSIFFFAEEAHLYLRETYWEDIVTRMRHIGFFATFITNQPDTIQDSIYRQADNIFLFNFSNERDLEYISRSAKVDSESIINIVRELPPHFCLLIGDLVNDFPIVVRVEDLKVNTMGETRYFFK